MNIIISFILIFLYVVSYFIIKKKIPHSLSATYYDFGVIFPIILFISCVLLIPTIVELQYSFLIFLSIGMILFVSFTPNYRNEELENNVHSISAVIGLILSQIWIGLVYSICLYFWLLIFIYIIIELITYKSIKKFFNESDIKFWAEIITLITIYITLLRLIF